MMMPQNNTETTGPAVWRDAESVCALADDERHLGHIFKVDEWQAFDATRPNAAGNGPREVGKFQNLAAAKLAVERSIARQNGETAGYQTKAAGFAWQA
jgi:hypothetical protein